MSDDEFSDEEMENEKTELKEFLNCFQSYTEINGWEENKKLKKDIEKFSEQFLPEIHKKQHKLKAHQIPCVQWLVSLYEAKCPPESKQRLGGLLADDMGLGKTYEILGYFKYLQHIGINGPFLVVVPLATLPTWEETATEFKFDVFVVRKKLTSRSTGKKEGTLPTSSDTGNHYGNSDIDKDNWKKRKDSTVVITTPTYIRRTDHHYKKQWFKAKQPWTVVAVDEAHNDLSESPTLKESEDGKITHVSTKDKKKQEGTDFKKALVDIATNKEMDFLTQIVLATGTPLKSNWQELANLFSIVMPKPLAPIHRSLRFENSVIKGVLSDLNSTWFTKYRDATKNIMLRRKPENVPELKDDMKTMRQMTVILEPTVRQQNIIINEFFEQMKEKNANELGEESNISLMEVKALRGSGDNQSLQFVSYVKSKFENILYHPDLLRRSNFTFDMKESAKTLFLDTLIKDRQTKDDFKMLVFFKNRKPIEYLFDYYNFRNESTKGKVGVIYGDDISYSSTKKDKYLWALAKDEPDAADKPIIDKKLNPHLNILEIIESQLLKKGKKKELTERREFGNYEFYQKEFNKIQESLKKTKKDDYKKNLKKIIDLQKKEKLTEKQQEELQNELKRKIGKELQRQIFIDSFNSENGSIDILFMNMIAAGAGINLPEGTTVVFFQISGTPNLEAQSQARAHRLNSQSDTNVFRLITNHTCEKWDMIKPYWQRMQRAFVMVDYNEENKGDFLQQFNREEPPYLDSLKSKLSVEGLDFEFQLTRDFFQKLKDTKARNTFHWRFFMGKYYKASERVKAETEESLKEEIRKYTNRKFMNFPLIPDPFYLKDQAQLITAKLLDQHMHPTIRDHHFLVEKSVQALESTGSQSLDKYKHFILSTLLKEEMPIFKVTPKTKMYVFRPNDEQNNNSTQTQETDTEPKKSNINEELKALLVRLGENTEIQFDDDEEDEEAKDVLEPTFLVFEDFLFSTTEWNVLKSNTTEILAKYNPEFWQKKHGCYLFLYIKKSSLKKDNPTYTIYLIFVNDEKNKAIIDKIEDLNEKYNTFIDAKKNEKEKTIYKLESNIKKIEFYISIDESQNFTVKFLQTNLLLGNSAESAERSLEIEIKDTNEEKTYTNDDIQIVDIEKLDLDDLEYQMKVKPTTYTNDDIQVDVVKIDNLEYRMEVTPTTSGSYFDERSLSTYIEEENIRLENNTGTITNNLNDIGKESWKIVTKEGSEPILLNTLTYDSDLFKQFQTFRKDEIIVNESDYVLSEDLKQSLFEKHSQRFDVFDDQRFKKNFKFDDFTTFQKENIIQHFFPINGKCEVAEKEDFLKMKDNEGRQKVLKTLNFFLPSKSKIDLGVE